MTFCPFHLGSSALGGWQAVMQILVTANQLLSCSSECLFCVQISEQKASLLFRMTSTLPVITFLKWKRNENKSLDVEGGGRIFGKVYGQFEA